MVKNREELIRIAESNSAQLKSELQNQIGSFIHLQNVTPAELDYLLGLDEGTIDAILSGEDELTVDTLSKLLVATNMVVEIKPIEMTPMRTYDYDMPRSGAKPSPEMMRNNGNGMPIGGFFPGEAPMPKPQARRWYEGDEGDEGDNIPKPNGALKMAKMARKAHFEPLRDARGRFAKSDKNPTVAKPIGTPHSPYVTMNDEQLINIIRNNIWDGEIDISHASHEDLAAFLMEKEKIMRTRRENNAGGVEQHRGIKEEQKPSETSKFLKMLQNTAKEAENNPQLMGTIRRFMSED